jgi:hypothetical protein
MGVRPPVETERETRSAERRDRPREIFNQQSVNFRKTWRPSVHSVRPKDMCMNTIRSLKRA